MRIMNPLCPTQHPARYTRVLRPDNSWQVPRGCALPRLRAQVQRQNPEKLCVPPVGVNAAAVVKPTVDCCQKYSAALGQIPTDAEFSPASHHRQTATSSTTVIRPSRRGKKANPGRPDDRQRAQRQEPPGLLQRHCPELHRQRGAHPTGLEILVRV